MNEKQNDPVNNPVNDPVNDRHKMIITLIRDNKYITRKQLSEKCKVSIETIKRDIRKLKVLKIIKRIGSDKTGYWKIIEITTYTKHTKPPYL